MKLAKTSQKTGFSLVEVALAMGVATFCLTSVVALLPAGINSNRDSIEQTAATALAQAVAADMQVSSDLGPRFTFTDGNGIQSRFIAEDGTVSPTLATTAGSASRYRLTVQRSAPTGSANTSPVRILVTWPAAADPAPTQWPTKASGFVEVVTVVNTL